LGKCAVAPSLERRDRATLDRLTLIVYDELRRLARRYMRGERPGHSLQTTALVVQVEIFTFVVPGAKQAQLQFLNPVLQNRMKNVKPACN
jgi:ECF sigma factor